MTPDEVNERLDKLFARKGITPAPVDPIAQLEGTSHLTDATVRLGPEEPAAPVVEIKSAPAAPRLAPQEVIIPEGAPLFGLAIPQFQAAWSAYVEETGQGMVQPNLSDAIAWFEKELNTPDAPSSIAHLVQASGETMAQIQARSGWHNPPSQASAGSTSRQRGSTFGDGFRRPGGR